MLYTLLIYIIINFFCETIERSKIVLNILFYDYNIVFDYYRNSFLLSNNILLVTECDEFIDIDIEPNLYSINENMNISTYNNLENKIDYLINITNDEYEYIINKQNNWFKKYNMKNYILDFFIK